MKLPSFQIDKPNISEKTEQLIKDILYEEEKFKSERKKGRGNPIDPSQKSKKTIDQFEDEEGGPIRTGQVGNAITRRSQNRLAQREKRATSKIADEDTSLPPSTERYEEDLQLDHTDDATGFMPFNLKREREEGYFDDDGNYIENKKKKDEEDGEHDAWLDSEATAIVDKATLARIEEQRQKEAEANRRAPLTDRQIATMKLEMSRMMNRCETVVAALRRLAAGSGSDRRGGEKGRGGGTSRRVLDRREKREMRKKDLPIQDPDDVGNGAKNEEVEIKCRDNDGSNGDGDSNGDSNGPYKNSESNESDNRNDNNNGNINNDNKDISNDKTHKSESKDAINFPSSGDSKTPQDFFTRLTELADELLNEDETDIYFDTKEDLERSARMWIQIDLPSSSAIGTPSHVSAAPGRERASGEVEGGMAATLPKESKDDVGDEESDDMFKDEDEEGEEEGMGTARKSEGKAEGGYGAEPSAEQSGRRSGGEEDQGKEDQGKEDQAKEEQGSERGNEQGKVNRQSPSEGQAEECEDKATRAYYMSWPVRELKRLLKEKGVADAESFVEKGEMVSRLMEALNTAAVAAVDVGGSGGREGELVGGKGLGLGGLGNLKGEIPMGYAFDSSSGLFYGSESGLYYHPDSGCFCGSDGRWFVYRTASNGSPQVEYV